MRLRKWIKPSLLTINLLRGDINQGLRRRSDSRKRSLLLVIWITNQRRAKNHIGSHLLLLLSRNRGRRWWSFWWRWGRWKCPWDWGVMLWRDIGWCHSGRSWRLKLTLHITKQNTATTTTIAITLVVVVNFIYEISATVNGMKGLWRWKKLLQHGQVGHICGSWNWWRWSWRN